MDNSQINLRKLSVSGKSVCNIFWLFFFLSLLLVGCETTKGPAPVVERVVVPEKNKGASDETSPDQYYIVQKGDTFYSIALNHGIDSKELAEWNNIDDTSTIRPGQRINLSVPSKKAEPALFAVPHYSVVPAADPELNLPGEALDQSVRPAHEVPMQKIKTYPKALKLPYSEQNVARLQYSVNPAISGPQSGYPPVSGSGTRIEDAPVLADSVSENTIHSSSADWMWPTTGHLLSSFSNNLKGLKISGQAGQSVVATADGEVVYSGNGLRGYGNLIIIKHNEALLSAYAHNRKLLVKEGETVIQGQKIAEMGNTDTDTPQLHFEIRRHGKPVDPLKFLPPDPG